MNGALHEQLKFILCELSLIQSAFESQGVERQGSGTAKRNYVIWTLCIVICEYILMQVVPSPVYGGMQVQINSLDTPIG